MKRPEASVATKFGVAPAPPTVTGGATAVRTPFASMAKTPTLPSTGSAVNRKSPFGEMAIEVGWAPTAMLSAGCTEPRPPAPGSITYAEMSPEVWLATYRKGPAGEATIAIGPLPAGKMLGGFSGTTILVLTGTVSSPLLLLISSTLIFFPPKLAMYMKSPGG